MLQIVNENKKDLSSYLLRLQETSDWCHLCGKRTSPFICIRYSENAEHDIEQNVEKTQYLRACFTCLNTITEFKQKTGK